MHRIGLSHTNQKTRSLAIADMQKRLIHAELGGCLHKQRVARPGKGKRGGHRTLVAFKKDERSIFVFGFSKNDCENIDAEEEKYFKRVAQYYLNLSNELLNELVSQKELLEVKYG